MIKSFIYNDAENKQSSFLSSLDDANKPIYHFENWWIKRKGNHLLCLPIISVSQRNVITDEGKIFSS